MKAAECRKQLNEPGSAAPVLGELTAQFVMQQASKKILQPCSPGTLLGLSLCLLLFCWTLYARLESVEIQLCAGKQT